MGSSVTTCRWRNQGTRKLTKSVYQRLNTAESSWHHSQRALAEICHLLPAHPSGSCSGPCFQGWVLEAEATVLVMMLCHVLTHGRCVCSVEAKRQQGDLCSQPCPCILAVSWHTVCTGASCHVAESGQDFWGCTEKKERIQKTGPACSCRLSLTPGCNFTHSEKHTCAPFKILATPRRQLKVEFFFSCLST